MALKLPGGCWPAVIPLEDTKHSQVSEGTHDTAACAVSPLLSWRQFHAAYRGVHDQLSAHDSSNPGSSHRLIWPPNGC